MTSLEVLEDAQASLSQQIQQLRTARRPVPDDLEDAQSGIAIKINLLRLRVETGQLSPEGGWARPIFCRAHPFQRARLPRRSERTGHACLLRSTGGAAGTTSVRGTSQAERQGLPDARGCLQKGGARRGRSPAAGADQAHGDRDHAARELARGRGMIYLIGLLFSTQRAPVVLLPPCERRPGAGRCRRRSLAPVHSG